MRLAKAIPIIKENRNLNWSIKHLQDAKESLYQYIDETEDADKLVAKWWPPDENAKQVKEGAEINDSEVLQIISRLDDIILAVVASTKKRDYEADELKKNVSYEVK